MTQVEKNTPRKGVEPTRTGLAIFVRELVETAFKDKGVWYSIEQSPDMNQGSIASVLNSAVGRLCTDISVRDNRIWILFYKDSDGVQKGGEDNAPTT